MPKKTRLGAAAPLPPDDDQLLDLIVAALTELPRPERNAVLAFIDFWRDLPSREDRALFAKATKPDLRDRDVARLCGVRRRQVYNWPRYQSFKLSIAEHRERYERGRCNPDRP